MHKIAAEGSGIGVQTLLIDNYDSYTYNLFQLIAEVNGELPTVICNDDLDWPTLRQQIAEGRFHNIVISPGPGTPARPGDIGVCMPLLRAQLGIPILGVCLGFQALALAHGGRVAHAPEPVHGRQSAVEHSGHALFHDIPSGAAYQVVRYHSLLVDWASLPPCLEPLAWTAGTHHALHLAGVPVPPHTAHEVNGLEGPQLQQQGMQQQDVQQQDVQQAARQAGQRPLLMAVAHRSLPHYGVQFHPESVATGFGTALLRNFRHLTAAFWGLPQHPALANLAGPPWRCLPALECATPESSSARHVTTNGSSSQSTLMLHYLKLPRVLGPVGGSERLFWELFGACSTEDTFWLDSATPDRGRFSFMGGPGGSLWRRVTYTLPALSTPAPAEAAAAAAAAAAVATAAAAPAGQEAAASAADAARAGAGAGAGLQQTAPAACHHPPPAPGTVIETDALGLQRSTASTLWAYLEERLLRWRCQVSKEEAQALPFDFWGGFVGYLGYELKAECGGSRAHASPLPDASLFLADRLLAVDHKEGDVYLLALYQLDGGSSSGGGGHADGAAGSSSCMCNGGRPGDGACSGGSGGSRSGFGASSPSVAHGGGSGSDGVGGCSMAEAQAWVAEVAARVHDLVAAPQQPGSPQQQQQQCAPSDDRQQQRQRQQQGEQQQQQEQQLRDGPPPFQLREGRTRYLDNVRACMQALYDGESYEVCLTTMLSREPAPDPRRLYTILRAVNPAPYAAWLHFGGGGPQVCCSSPERFLRMGREGILEAKPIKGTAPRGKDPESDAKAAAALAASEKDRAENLMIVDLLRNDLGRVCEPGSVTVPGLMEIESYATVHQMVSTVRGRRREGCSAVDCIRAAFPGGSMTGAPKIRTMEIIDKLEGGPRGIYSGSVGFIGLNGTFDLNIVIRTAVVHGGQVSIGAGGAIVVQSDPEGEYDEMRLKAAALLRAVGMCDGSGAAAAAAAVDES